MKKSYLLLVVLLLGVTSCSTVRLSYLRGDVIGFSQDVRTSYQAGQGPFRALEQQSEPYDLLKDDDVARMHAFIDNDIPRGMNTSAYYAMELAVDRIKYIRKHSARGDKFTKYYIFLLTDGLDNSSAIAAENAGLTLAPIDPDKYPERLKQKLEKAMGRSRNTFEVYPMLYEGDDIRSIMQTNNLDTATFHNYLRQKFECFRYSSVGRAPELIFSDNYRRIFADMRERFISSSYEFRVPKGFAGRKVKMRFMSSKGEEGELTGSFVRNGNSYTLQNLELKGMEINMRSSAYATDDGHTLIAVTSNDSTNSNVYFRIEELRRDGKAFVVGDRARDVNQYYYDNGLWIVNSEYNSERIVNLDTYFILVVDGSMSLDGPDGNSNGFEAEKQMAREIINLVLKPGK